MPTFSDVKRRIRLRERQTMDDDLHHILVVDDEEIVRRVVSAMLAKMGLQATCAENGEIGRDLFFSNKFDLVITDYDMPGISGTDLAEQIKKNSPTTLIVLITGCDKELVLSKITDNSVDQVLFKPFSFAEMAGTVRKLLHS